MSSFVPSQELIGKAFAIAGLALVAPSTYFFRNYSRVLDCVQMFYVFALAYASTYNVFSLSMPWGFLSFMPSFISNYCHDGEFLCTYGYLISPAISWFGAALLVLIIVLIVSCKKNNVRYQSFYIFWKGLFRWFSVPLAYYCTFQIITSLQLEEFKPTEVNFDAAVIIAGIIFIWMFVELIGHTKTQKPEENNWKKWCDFFSTFRAISVMALVVVSLKINSMAKFFIYGPIVIYDIVFLLKYKFTFRVFERFIFIIQEAVLITVFSLFIFNTSYIYDNNIDLFGLGIVILLELLIFLPKLVAACKSGEDESDPSINPEGKLERSPGIKKNNNSFNDNLAP